MTKRVFGELELSILHIFKSDERMTVKDVHRILGGADKYNTIMTVMNRLVEKKQLARERTGLQYQYWILAPQPRSLSFIEQFKQKIFGYKTTAMVSYLIESADDITEADLIEMEKVIHQAKEKRHKQ